MKAKQPNPDVTHVKGVTSQTSLIADIELLGEETFHTPGCNHLQSTRSLCIRCRRNINECCEWTRLLSPRYLIMSMQMFQI